MKKHTLTKTLIAVAAGATLALAASSGQAADFDNELRGLRLNMISMCKQLMAGKPRESKQQLLSEIDNIIADWKEITRKYQANPPAQYAKDPGWKSYFSLAADNLAIMRSKVDADNLKRAMMFCGMNCGLFVEIHEVNGVATPADRMFHIRKHLKMAVSMAKAGNWQGVTSVLDKNQTALKELKKFPAKDKAAYAGDMKKLDSAFAALSAAAAKKGAKEFGGAFMAFLKVFGNVYINYL